MENKNEDINFAKKKLDELREKIKQYGYSYHVTNSPEVSNAEYDDLVQQLRYYEVLWVMSYNTCKSNLEKAMV